MADSLFIPEGSLEPAGPNRQSRRDFLRNLGRLGIIAPAFGLPSGLPGIRPPQKSTPSTARTKPRTVPVPVAGFSFTDIAAQAGLAAASNVFGNVARKQYILEETGCGVALFDYDNDGWLDSSW